jgi:hypothetical protein
MSRESRSDRTHKSPRQRRAKPKGEQPSQEAVPSKFVVVVLDAARREGHKILSDPQYDHVVDLLKRLVDFGNQEELGDLSIEPISSFWELREKGGILGKINLRVYFGTLPEVQELIVAKAYKKHEEGQTPPHVIVAVENRLEEYKHGRSKKSAIAYQEASKE